MATLPGLSARSTTQGAGLPPRRPMMGLSDQPLSPEPSAFRSRPLPRANRRLRAGQGDDLERLLPRNRTHGDAGGATTESDVSQAPTEGEAARSPEDVVPGVSVHELLGNLGAVLARGGGSTVLMGEPQFPEGGLTELTRQLANAGVSLQGVGNRYNARSVGLGEGMPARGGFMAGLERLSQRPLSPTTARMNTETQPVDAARRTRLRELMAQHEAAEARFAVQEAGTGDIRRPDEPAGDMPPPLPAGAARPSADLEELLGRLQPDQRRIAEGLMNRRPASLHMLENLARGFGDLPPEGRTTAILSLASWVSVDELMPGDGNRRQATTGPRNQSVTAGFLRGPDTADANVRQVALYERQIAEPTRHMPSPKTRNEATEILSFSGLTEDELNQALEVFKEQEHGMSIENHSRLRRLPADTASDPKLLARWALSFIRDRPPAAEIAKDPVRLAAWKDARTARAEERRGALLDQGVKRFEEALAGAEPVTAESPSETSASASQDVAELVARKMDAKPMNKSHRFRNSDFPRDKDLETKAHTSMLENVLKRDAALHSALQALNLGLKPLEQAETASKEDLRRHQVARSILAPTGRVARYRLSQAERNDKQNPPPELNARFFRAVEYSAMPSAPEDTAQWALKMAPYLMAEETIHGLVSDARLSERIADAACQQLLSSAKRRSSGPETAGTHPDTQDADDLARWALRQMGVGEQIVASWVKGQKSE